MIRSYLHAGAQALVAALALAAFAAAPACAAAPSPPPVAFALTPVGTSVSILLHGSAGDVLRGAVSVRNLSRRPITVILQRADIDNASNGNADYVTTHVAHAGRWLSLTTTTVRLAPHATRHIAYTVRIPAGTAGASHYGGIVAINAADLAAVAVHRKAKGNAFTFYRITRQALPLTIRLPGRLFRRMALRSVNLSVQPVGAGLVLGLLPGGSELTEQARIQLHVTRGRHRVLAYAATLGQLFPGAILDYRIAWPGHPTPGTYHVLGTIRPQGSATIYINRTITFTAAKATQLKRETVPGPQPPTPGIPAWVWVALSLAAILLIVLSLTIWKLTRRPVKAAT